MIVLVIPEDYARDIRRGVLAKLQLLVDGTNSNTATIALGYAGGIVAVANQQEIEDDIRRKGLRMFEAGIREEPRVWFNPSLRAINYMVPGIICVLLMEMMVPLTAFSLVRERERGTIEQLMVTPVRAAEVAYRQDDSVHRDRTGGCRPDPGSRHAVVWCAASPQHRGAVRVYAPVHRGRAGARNSRGDICRAHSNRLR